MASPNASGTYASAAPRGFALGAHASDPEALGLAQGLNFIGFLTRDVVAGGLALADRIHGVTSATPVGLESPFLAGDPVTVEPAVEIEAEGAALLLTSGTGALTTSSAIGIGLSFKNGKVYAAQSGDSVYFTLSALFTAAADIYDSTNNTFRIRAVRA